ncbi:MAG TPA: DUF2614 family zinc ribbon-containing protein [Patescibacteria group bacterium]
MISHRFWHSLLVIIEHLVKAPFRILSSIVLILVGLMIISSQIGIVKYIFSLPLIIFGVAFFLISIQDFFGGLFNRKYQEAECPFCSHKQPLIRNTAIHVCINCKEKFSVQKTILNE